MTLEFPKSVAVRIGYYVYILRDPETDEVFYVGKGTGNRVFTHVRAAIENPSKNDRLQRIRKIRAKDLEVKYEILRHGLSEKEAYEVEAAVIDYVCLPNLTNKVIGHDTENRGRMTVPAIVAAYGAEPVEIKEAVLLIIPNKLFERNITPEKLYEITRGNWVVGERRNKAKYAFSVYNGVVIEVYRISRWFPVQARDKQQKTQNRWRFDGEVAAELQYYVGKSVASYIGAQNPVRYVNC
ncbi:LEM-3-like GIY-YIG domain-containing protein [Dehalococcoides mccartyi]|uniref:LEM-3-like GIY-YIG domain-containing protein n=1 Tax=Dehalococcoides mccartyi TaxID=61435 RepID=UPI0001BDCB9A|nr:hypothetical protein [Dehalococcoides mccartyi]AQX72728.1 hypothetical protein B1775_00815 [Dehalococcoides mccartyi]